MWPHWPHSRRLLPRELIPMAITCDESKVRKEARIVLESVSIKDIKWSPRQLRFLPLNENGLNMKLLSFQSIYHIVFITIIIPKIYIDFVYRSLSLSMKKFVGDLLILSSDLFHENIVETVLHNFYSLAKRQADHILYKSYHISHVDEDFQTPLVFVRYNCEHLRNLFRIMCFLHTTRVLAFPFLRSTTHFWTIHLDIHKRCRQSAIPHS